MTFGEKEYFSPQMRKSTQKSLFLPKGPKSIANIVENVRRMHFWQKMTKFGEKVHISPKSAKMTKKSKKLKKDGKCEKLTLGGPK